MISKASLHPLLFGMVSIRIRYINFPIIGHRATDRVRKDIECSIWSGFVVGFLERKWSQLIAAGFIA